MGTLADVNTFTSGAGAECYRFLETKYYYDCNNCL